MSALSRTATLIAAASLLLVSAQALGAFTVNTTPKVTFHATGTPGALDIEGKSTSLTLVDDGTNLTFSVPMSTVTTGISIRDSHMRDEYVQVATYPLVSLVVSRGDVTLPTEVGKSTTGTIPGTFTVRDIPRPVSVSYTAKKDNTGYTLKGSFPFNVSEHGINIPSYLGVTIDPAMSAEVSFHVVE